jgi:hypothetical protein
MKTSYTNNLQPTGNHKTVKGNSKIEELFFLRSFLSMKERKEGSFIYE